MLENVLAHYRLKDNTLEPFGSGLINRTWKLTSGGRVFILQQVNHQIFPEPQKIAGNISRVAAYLKKEFPDYMFVAPVESTEKSGLVRGPDGSFYRLFPFVADSHTLRVVDSADQAFEAARQFGRLTRLLSGFPARSLQITLPDFHHLPLRYAQFEEALQKGNRERLYRSAELAAFMQEHFSISEQYLDRTSNPAFKIRVTHHDTKISNVLFDKSDRGLCVIDLDTLMPGYFFSDVGDMMRTYLCPVSEEETDLSKIGIRDDIFEAIVEGYLSEMKNDLTQEEQHSFLFAGKFMIYMQALRFLTDYLNNDRYYGAQTEDQNYHRSRNQAQLLKVLLQKEPDLERRIRNLLQAP